MNWKQYVPQVIAELNELQTLPKTGLLAGGAIANKIWEKITKKPMPVNDIDIFIYDKHLEPSNSLDIDKYKNYIYSKKDVTKNFDSYAGIRYESKHSKCYKIEKHSRDNLLNFVNYTASTTDYNIILESFDINCTQVGYNLETGELLFTDGFDKFAQTGKLEIMCANAPAHTLIRLLKKRDELSATVAEVEFKYLMAARAQSYDNFIRHYFGEKYFELLSPKWLSELQNMGFVLKRIEQTQHRDQHNLSPNLWTIDVAPGKRIFDNYNYLNAVPTLNDLDFYMRNIYGDAHKEMLWRKFGILWSRNKEYVTGTTLVADEHKLETVLANIPEISLSLQGLSFNEQLSAIDNIFNITDKESATCILKTCSVGPNITEDDVLLMSLRARKLIHLRENNRRNVGRHYEINLPF